jgi:nitrite reductase/ring-hydroxylating ferredoxin subunit
MEQHKVRVANLADVSGRRCSVVYADGRPLALFMVEGKVYAVDNRCPHMGFPLDRGSVQDGILTCHWHHARFDLASGGTFDLFADDVPVYPAWIEDGSVWVDLTPQADPYARLQERLRHGLKQNISLVIAKALIGMADYPEGNRDAFRIVLDFGVHYHRNGWQMGQTINAVMMNLQAYLDPAVRPHALYQGALAVAEASDGIRFTLDPLPRQDIDLPTLKRWFRQFVEVRDSEGAERCLTSAVCAGASPGALADILFSAATDHRYLSIGHVADFTNKAFEALDVVGWTAADASLVLSSLIQNYTRASRQEESNAWRHPIDLVALLDDAFEQLEQALAEGRARRGTWQPIPEALVETLLSDDPAAIVSALLDALRTGATEEALAATVTYAAIRRMVHFHTSNEFGDWDTVLHTLSFANALHQAIRRMGEAVSPEILRGVFDAAMSIYLDRFLNIPAAPIPQPGTVTASPEALLEELLDLLDHQQEIDAAGDLVARYMMTGANPLRLIATLGQAMVREDRDFHTIQSLEAAVRQHERWKGTPAATHALIAAARYLAAHAPTSRADTQTFRIARRLHRGEKVFEG